MRKIVTFLICTVLLTGISFASTVPTADIEEILSCMDIMNNLDNTSLTRAELAEILTKASQYKGLAAAGVKISPFSDVTFNHEAAPYIRIIAQKGIMTAYSDGQFKPEKEVTYDEVVTTVLKLLGYTKEDFSAGYPVAQLMIASDIGLTDGVNANSGCSATREMVGRIIYNALSCSTKDGQNYAKLLGYTLTSDVITLSDVMVNVTGPITCDSDIKNTLFGLNNPKIYIDGKEGESRDVSVYDILYYSIKSNSIWVYKDKITGVVESISPNKETPTSVTISGKNYNLATYAAQKAFGINGIETGKMATILLDRNSQVADAYLTADLYKEQVGVITAAGKKEMIASDGTTKTSYYATILLTTGEKIDIATTSNYSEKVGYTAKISYSVGAARISSISKSTEFYGSFNSTGYTMGKNKLSKNIRILEVDSYGNTTSVTPDRLNSVYLNKGDVALVTKDATGAIDSMVIKDVTGDTASYGIVTDIEKAGDNERYSYLLEGEDCTYSNETTFNIAEGPTAIFKEGQSIAKMEDLKRIEGSIIDINNLYLINSKGDRYKVSSNVTVYNTEGTKTVLSSMEEAMSGKYNVSAYYDDTEKNGGLVRIICIS